MDPKNSPPHYEDQVFSCSWLGSILGKSIQRVTHQPLTDSGGMSCCIQRIQVLFSDDTSTTFIFKQLTGEEKCKTSRNLMLIREVNFYNSELSKNFKFIPKSYYAYGDKVTGEKFLLLEDLAPAVPATFFFGPGNPNNWAKPVSELNSIVERFEKVGATLEVIIRHTFICLAQLHARFWMKREILDIDWLRGHDWWKQEGDDYWYQVQNPLKLIWATVKQDLTSEGFDKKGVQWHPNYVALIEASLDQISVESYKNFTQKTRFTLVTGDCHPANFMWMPNVDFNDAVKCVDFEMIAVGSGPQDLAQYLISHVEPKKRQLMERDLILAYHDQLLKCGVSDYPLEACWHDYIYGGAERWIWLAVFLSDKMPKEMITFFNHQTWEFCKDHQITPKNIGQPRP